MNRLAHFNSWKARIPSSETKAKLGNVLIFNNHENQNKVIIIVPEPMIFLFGWNFAAHTLS